MWWHCKHATTFRLSQNRPIFYIHCSLLAFCVQIGFQRWQRHTLLQFGRNLDGATVKVYDS